MKFRVGRWVGLLMAVAGLAQAQTQVLYVGDSGDGTIKRVDAAGNVSTYATGLANIYGLAVDTSGTLYVSSTTAHKIVTVDSAGNVTDFATNFPGTANLLGMTFDAAGNLYVADVSVGIYKVTTGGAVSLWATGISYPRDVAFNAGGVLHAVGGYNPMTMYSIASDGTPTLFVSMAANAGFGSIVFGYNGDALVTAPTLNDVYRITTAGVVNTYDHGPAVTDLVYAGNGTQYFLNGGVLYRDVAGTINTFATGFSNPTSLALVTAVPEPVTTATAIGGLALVAVGCARMRRRRAD